MKQFALLSILTLISSISAAIGTQEKIYLQCGGQFASFKENFKQVALEKGYPEWAVNKVFQSAQYSTAAVNEIQKKGGSVFQQNFSDFYKERGSSYTRNILKNALQKYQRVFDLAEANYGVAKEVLVTFWQLETNLGSVQGNYNTINSLVTLAHNCERPGLFQPQVLAAIRLVEMGIIDPATTTGAWAGEVGQFQFLPQNILDFGVDGDGDGRIDLKNSAADAILSAANMMMFEGWQKDQPWVEEVQVTSNSVWERSGLETKLSRSQWSQLGVKDQNGQNLVSNPELKASLVAPEGNLGSIFLVYDNFDIFLEWNQSLIYILSAANVSNGLLPHVSPLQAKRVNNGLSTEQLMRLQAALSDKGYDVGEVDGILGSGTRSSVRILQKHFGLPRDGWPTQDLYKTLGL